MVIQGLAEGVADAQAPLVARSFLDVTVSTSLEIVKEGCFEKGFCSFNKNYSSTYEDILDYKIHLKKILCIQYY